MECIPEKNKKYCNCTYEPCVDRNTSAECLHYHRKTESSLPVSSARKMNAHMTDQLLISYAYKK